MQEKLGTLPQILYRKQKSRDYRLLSAFTRVQEINRPTSCKPRPTQWNTIFLIPFPVLLRLRGQELHLSKMDRSSGEVGPSPIHDGMFRKKYLIRPILPPNPQAPKPAFNAFSQPAVLKNPLIRRRIVTHFQCFSSIRTHFRVYLAPTGWRTKFLTYGFCRNASFS